MNSTPQLDLHPDADSLSAFAEQALAAPEREQVLAHLAACSRCRQVIFLAQQAAADAEASMPAWVPAARPRGQSGAWFRNWRYAWAPAAALAAAVALVVVFHPRPTGPARSLPVPRQQAVAGALARPAPVVPAKSTASRAKAAAFHAPGFTAPANANANLAQLAPLESAQGPAPEVSPVQFKPEPAVTASVQQQRPRMAAVAAKGAATVQGSEAKFRSSADRVPAHGTVSAAAAAPQLATPVLPANAFSAGLQRGLAAAPAARAAGSTRLPSGLTAVSTATAAQHTLAIDLAGALFLSEDWGKHWEPVARQWTGRPIEVRVQRDSSGNAPPVPAFELVSDGGLVWVSPDGRTWAAK